MLFLAFSATTYCFPHDLFQMKGKLYSPELFIHKEGGGEMNNNPQGRGNIIMTVIMFFCSTNPSSGQGKYDIVLTFINNNLLFKILFKTYYFSVRFSEGFFYSILLFCCELKPHATTRPIIEAEHPRPWKWQDQHMVSFSKAPYFFKCHFRAFT